MRLKDVTVRAKKPTAKPARYADGRGLYLLVMPTGGRLWRFDYRLHGRRKTMSLGRYPDVSLESARKRLAAARELVADGLDPVDAKRAVARATRAADTFATVAAEWLAKQRYAPTTITRHRSLLDRILLPALGRRTVASIEPSDVLAAVTVLDVRGKHASARRAKIICGQVLRYAVATGRTLTDATAGLRGALAREVTTHRPALTEPTQVGALLRAMADYDGSPTVAAMLRLAPLVFVRPGELRHAEWTEIDLDNALWRIPAAKMKMRTEHLVPLSRQALAILRALPRRGRYVFPSPRTAARPTSNNTMNAALRRLGYEPHTMTTHGFRAMARTLLDEQLHVAGDVIEAQLAHRVRGPLGAAYNRSAYLAQRTAVMQQWADYLDALAATTPVTSAASGS